MSKSNKEELNIFKIGCVRFLFLSYVVSAAGLSTEGTIFLHYF